MNFARIPDWRCHALAVFGAVAASHCADDVLATARAPTTHLGWFIGGASPLLQGGTCILDKKSLPSSNICRILGAESDLSRSPHHTHTSTPNHLGQTQQLTLMLVEVMDKGIVVPGFATTRMFGRFAKAMLRAFSRRQHERGVPGSTLNFGLL